MPEALEVDVVKAVSCPVAPAFLRSVLRAAWAVVGGPGSAGLAVRITGDRELRRLNRDFLGIDAPTDVLSFPSGSEEGHLGDIAISWPAVVRQAAAFGEPPAAELALLSVHGLLHLLGRDHATPAEERAMWAETWRCLSAAGVEGIATGRLPQRS